MKGYQILLSAIFLLCSIQPIWADLGCDVSPATISSESDFTNCIDDDSLALVEIMVSEFIGDNSVFVVIDAIESIRGIYTSNVIPIEELGIGFFSIYHLALAGDLDNLVDLEVGNKLFSVGGCYVLSNPVQMHVENCSSICQAYVGHPIYPEFGCDGSVEISSTGTNVAFNTYYLLGDGESITHVNTTGFFTDIPKGDYNVTILNSEIEIEFDLEVENNLEEILSGPESCYQQSSGNQPVIVLDPTVVVIDEDCDVETGTFTLTVGFQGGLPWYDFQSWYNVEGSSLSGQFTYDDGITLEFVQNQTYEFSVSDDSGCPPTEVSGAPEPCIKFIELQEFDGEAFAEFNLLTWSTETEEGVDYFEVTKSYNGVLYEAIAQVEAAGNSNVIQNYSYSDMEEGVAQEPLLYYQLVVYSEDGESEKSEIVIIQRTPAEPSGLEDGADPQVIMDWVNQTVTANADLGNATLQLFDQQGKLIQSENLQIKNGVNTIGINRRIPRGLYFYRLQVGSQLTSGKCYLR